MKSLWRTSGEGQYHPAELVGESYAWCGSREGEECCVRGDWAGKRVDVNFLNEAWWVGVACRGGMWKLAVA